MLVSSLIWRNFNAWLWLSRQDVKRSCSDFHKISFLTFSHILLHIDFFFSRSESCRCRFGAVWQLGVICHKYSQKKKTAVGGDGTRFVEMFICGFASHSVSTTKQPYGSPNQYFSIFQPIVLTFQPTPAIRSFGSPSWPVLQFQLSQAFQPVLTKYTLYK